MRKLSIPSQLIILVFTVVLVSMLTFTLTSIIYIREVTQNQYLERLDAAAKNIYYSNVSSTSYEIEEGNNTYYEAFPIYFYKYYPNSVARKSKNYGSCTLLDTELEILIAECQATVSANPEFVYGQAGSKRFSSGVFYYSYVTNDVNASYTIVITDDIYVSTVVKKMVLQVAVMFFLVIIIAIFVIYMWSNTLTRRIKKIQNHVQDLPKSKYTQQYRDQGEDELGELSRSIEDLRREVMNSEKTKREMLQNISHDFKTPIAIIKSYAEAMQDGMADDNAPEIIINQANSLTKKVSYLLQYNSLEYLTKDRPFEDINMNSVINEVVSSFKFQLKEMDLNIELQLDDDVYFKGYRENWYTVVSNIMDNAKRYAKSTIKIILKKDRLRIYNDGEPIDVKFTDSKFKPYEKGSKGQFGLGMSIVKKTVNFFEMELTAVNEESGGVSFIIEKFD